MSSYTVINPATATPVTDVHLASADEADRAIEAAHGAFPAWRALPPGERAALLRRFAAVVDAHVEELAELEVRNAGHTWGNAGRPATSGTASTTTRVRRSGSSAARSRWPAAST
jgi:acyl-CoA reductase-like NAD-dependent aldehyde dehydrogenase